LPYRAKGLWVLGGSIEVTYAQTQSWDWYVCGPVGRGYWPTIESRGVCEPALKPRIYWEDLYPENGVQGRDQNRTREIRPSGIVGRLVETWAMEMAKRARKAETLTQTSHFLRLSRTTFLSRQPHVRICEGGAGRPAPLLDHRGSNQNQPF